MNIQQQKEYKELVENFIENGMSLFEAKSAAQTIMGL